MSEYEASCVEKLEKEIEVLKGVIKNQSDTFSDFVQGSKIIRMQSTIDELETEVSNLKMKIIGLELKRHQTDILLIGRKL